MDDDVRSCSTDVRSVDSLALPKRQKVFDKTFLPAGDTLPVWATVPLDGKLPVPPSPRGFYTLYTHKVGEPKYINRQRLDFDLTNPQGREAPRGYDSLTDPSLKQYFASPRTKRHLVEGGLITDRGEIVCNVREFNEYREFVRYRSVTELSLAKKKEKRVEKEREEQLFLEWPVVHRKKRQPKKEKLRQVYSEPPRHSHEPLVGLDAYKEDLSAGLKRTDMIRRREEMRKSGRTPLDVYSPRRREGTAYDMVSPRRQTPLATPGSPRRRENTQLDHLATPRRIRTDSGDSYGRPTLVEDMRRKEQMLKARLEEQKRQREEEYRKKMEESWRERQIRQEKLLQHEADVDAKVKEERSHHILEREKTLMQQRQKQEAKLRRIRLDLAKQRGGRIRDLSPGKEEETTPRKPAPQSNRKHMTNGDDTKTPRDEENGYDEHE